MQAAALPVQVQVLALALARVRGQVQTSQLFLLSSISFPASVQVRPVPLQAQEPVRRPAQGLEPPQLQQVSQQASHLFYVCLWSVCLACIARSARDARALPAAVRAWSVQEPVRRQVPGSVRSARAAEVRGPVSVEELAWLWERAARQARGARPAPGSQPVEPAQVPARAEHIRVQVREPEQRPEPEQRHVCPSCLLPLSALVLVTQQVQALVRQAEHRPEPVPARARSSYVMHPGSLRRWAAMA